MISKEIIFAGFGGQGILYMGKLLAYAAINEGLNVSWLPSYGPEMRGGTANCSVIITDGIIGSPVITKADAIVVMNKPSLEKFEPDLKKDGLLIMNSDLIDIEPIRTDIKVINISANTLVKQIGVNAVANMILLGALVEAIKIIKFDILIDTLKEHGKESFYNSNKKALYIGRDEYEKQMLEILDEKCKL